MRTSDAVKAVLITLTLGLVLSPAAPAWARSHASVEVDLGLFYNDLAPHGEWVEVRDHGWVWAPRVHADWRPYEVGHWVWTDDYGWLWESDEDFGWAVYHYGRWYRDPVYSWVWVPGYEWGPAWVSWRFGGGYVGWAPLPPRAVWAAGIGLGLGGAQIDALIEPRAYSFCSERMFFDPAVNRHLLPVTRNAAIITVTRNVTDYGVVNTRVIDRGLGVDRLEAAVGRRAPRPRVLEVDSVGAVRGAHGQRDAVTIFRPAVRPRADLTPPRGRAIVRGQPAPSSRPPLEPERRQIEKRREAEEKEAAKQLARQRELHERTRQEMERRQAAERRILEQQHGRENKKPPAVANLEQRQEQEHRALEERQHQERRQLEASREEARRQREAQASAERRSALSRAPGHSAASSKGKEEAKGKETQEKGSKAKPKHEDRQG